MSHRTRSGFFVRKLCGPTAWFWSGSPRRRAAACIVALVTIATGAAIADVYLRNLFPFLDFTGFSGTYSKTGSVDLSGPFFQSLGTNGRTCGTCHAPATHSA